MNSPGPLDIPPPRPSTPTSAPKIIGTLSIIFASLVGFGGLLGSCSGLMVSSFGKTSLPPGSDQILKPMASVYGGIAIQSLILLAMSGLLLAVGIGQLRYREWARRWSVYWGVLGIVAVVALVAISMLVLGPAYKDMIEATTHLNRAGAQPMPSAVSSVFGASFAFVYVLAYLPYPILMLAVFTRPKIRLAMYR